LKLSKKKNLLNHLNSFLFREDVALTLSNHFILALQGPKSQGLKQHFTQSSASIPEKPNDVCEFIFEELPSLSIAKPLTGEDGCALVFQTESKETVMHELSTFELENFVTQIDDHSQEVFRMKGYQLQYEKPLVNDHQSGLQNFLARMSIVHA
jgi:hypothetical protein